MKHMLRIVLVLALVLLPITPMDAYAIEDPWLFAGLAFGGTFLFLFLTKTGEDPPGPHDFTEQEQAKALQEKLSKLKVEKNLVPPGGSQFSNQSNGRGVTYPIFEW